MPNIHATNINRAAFNIFAHLFILQDSGRASSDKVHRINGIAGTSQSNYHFVISGADGFEADLLVERVADT